jgi:hypothetical protein
MSLTVHCDTLGHFARDKATVQIVRNSLTHRGSDFNARLGRFLTGCDLPHPLDRELLIAVVRDQSAVVGWCRTEVWTDTTGVEWQTLESFVATAHRRKGVAALAATAIAADYLLKHHVAVFHWSMILVANRAGMAPTLFQKDAEGVWRLAE